MSTERGKAIIFNGAGKPLEEKQFELPTNLEPMEALVEISLSTVCGSDVHTWMGHRPFPTQSILGHEMVGKIIKIGSELKKDFLGNSLAEGDRITWSMTVSCGKCFFCKTAKLPQKCYELFKYGHVQSDKPPYFTGGYARYVHLRKGSYIFKVPSELSDEEVAPLMCAGATVIGGMDAADFSSSDYVVVQGCGALGLYACAFAKELGAREVIAIDVDFQRLELAKQFGADYTIKADSNSTIEKVKELTKNRGADYAFEVAGIPKVIEQGIKFLRIGGKYILLGAIYPGNNFTIDSSDIITKCLKIYGQHNYNAIHLQNAIQLVQKTKNKYPFTKIVGPIFEFSKKGLEDAFKSLASKKSIRPGIIPN